MGYRRDIVVEIVPLNKKYQVFGYMDENFNENFGYFVFLSESDKEAILLKKERITFIGEKRAVTSYDTPRSARYKRWSDKFFIKVGCSFNRFVYNNRCSRNDTSNTTTSNTLTS